MLSKTTATCVTAASDLDFYLLYLTVLLFVWMCFFSIIQFSSGGSAGLVSDSENSPKGKITDV